jgi:hypothetical protein
MKWLLITFPVPHLNNTKPDTCQIYRTLRISHNIKFISSGDNSSLCLPHEQHFIKPKVSSLCSQGPNSCLKGSVQVQVLCFFYNMLCFYCKELSAPCPPLQYPESISAISNLRICGYTLSWRQYVHVHSLRVLFYMVHTTLGTTTQFLNAMATYDYSTTNYIARDFFFLAQKPTMCQGPLIHEVSR